MTVDSIFRHFTHTMTSGFSEGRLLESSEDKREKFKYCGGSNEGCGSVTCIPHYAQVTYWRVANALCIQENLILTADSPKVRTLNNYLEM